MKKRNIFTLLFASIAMLVGTISGVSNKSSEARATSEPTLFTGIGDNMTFDGYWYHLMLNFDEEFQTGLTDFEFVDTVGQYVLVNDKPIFSTNIDLMHIFITDLSNHASFGCNSKNIVFLFRNDAVNQGYFFPVDQTTGYCKFTLSSFEVKGRVVPEINLYSSGNSSEFDTKVPEKEELVLDSFDETLEFVNGDYWKGFGLHFESDMKGLSKSDYTEEFYNHTFVNGEKFFTMDGSKIHVFINDGAYCTNASTIEYIFVKNAINYFLPTDPTTGFCTFTIESFTLDGNLIPNITLYYYDDKFSDVQPELPELVLDSFDETLEFVNGDYWMGFGLYFSRPILGISNPQGDYTQIFFDNTTVNDEQFFTMDGSKIHVFINDGAYSTSGSMVEFIFVKNAINNFLPSSYLNGYCTFKINSFKLGDDIMPEIILYYYDGKFTTTVPEIPDLEFVSLDEEMSMFSDGYWKGFGIHFSRPILGINDLQGDYSEIFYQNISVDGKPLFDESKLPDSGGFYHAFINHAPYSPSGDVVELIFRYTDVDNIFPINAENMYATIHINEFKLGIDTFPELTFYYLDGSLSLEKPTIEPKNSVNFERFVLNMECIDNYWVYLALEFDDDIQGLFSTYEVIDEFKNHTTINGEPFYSYDISNIHIFATDRESHQKYYCQANRIVFLFKRDTMQYFFKEPESGPILFHMDSFRFRFTNLPELNFVYLDGKMKNLAEDDVSPVINAEDNIRITAEKPFISSIYISTYDEFVNNSVPYEYEFESGALDENNKLVKGTWNLEIRATDYNNNFAVKNVIVNVVDKDVIAPTISFNLSELSLKNGDYFEFNISATDNEDDVELILTWDKNPFDEYGRVVEGEYVLTLSNTIPLKKFGD